MQIGRNRHGSLRCRFPSGCRETRPVLPWADNVALMLFFETLTQWEHVADFGVLLRTSLRYSSVDDAAERHGYVSPVEPHVLGRIRILEQWQLKEDQRRRQEAMPPDNQKSRQANKEPVN